MMNQYGQVFGYLGRIHGSKKRHIRNQVFMFTLRGENAFICGLLAYFLTKLHTDDEIDLVITYFF